MRLCCRFRRFARPGWASALLVLASLGFVPELSVGPAGAAEVCTEPRQPRIPRGISVQRREMEDAERDLSNYLHQNRLYVNCLQRALRQAEQDAGKLASEFNRQIDIYNSRSPQ